MVSMAADSSNVSLPPGFRFRPTDEELLVHFLQRKTSLLPCHPDVIPDLDLYPYDPWQLQGSALGEGNRWYFFSRKTHNRTTASGYWKPLGNDETVYTSCGSRKVGLKKHFAFCVGEAITSWTMQEYRLSDPGNSSTRSSSKRKGQKQDYSKWVVCRVQDQSCNVDDDDGTELSCLDEVFLSLDDYDDISFPN